MSDSDDEVARRLDDIYRSAFGAECRVFHIPAEKTRPGMPHIDVYIFTRPSESVLVTAGMSTRGQGSVEHPTHRQRLELYARVPLDLEGDSLVDMCWSLWMLAQWPFRGDSPRFLAEWQMVGGMPPLVRGSALNAFMLTMPMKPDQAMADVGKLLEAQLLYAYGISDAERLECQRRGPSEMVESARAIMQRAGVLTDPRRPSVASA